MSNGPVEPAADLRQVANWIRQMYLALQQEGFTEQQSLVIVGQILGAQTGGQL